MSTNADAQRLIEEAAQTRGYTLEMHRINALQICLPTRNGPRNTASSSRPPTPASAFLIARPRSSFRSAWKPPSAI